jgi:xylulokinase
MDTLLALDLGTSGCRAELFGLDGRNLARCHQEYGLLSPEPGAAEQDADMWWAELAGCVRAALVQAGATHVQAIGVSAQGHSWLPVDAQLRPLRPALTWLDARSGPQARRLLEQYGADFWGALAGKLPGQWHMLPQLLWLREHDPQSLAGARHLLCAHDYLVARLTGEIVTDYTNAATTLLFDIAQGQWSERLLADWDVDRALLPKVKPAGTLAGTLTPDAARELGLSPGLPVAVGAQDQKCAALAAGLRLGTATASLGTATAIIAMADEPRFSPQHGAIPCFPYLQRGEWVLEAPLATSGGAMRWWRDVLPTTYDKMVHAAKRVPPGAEGVLFFPYLAGAAAPFWHGDLRGAFCGLGLSHSSAHMTRAVLESVAYDIRANLDCMRALGCDLDRLILFGGGARSNLWPQIIAAVCPVPVEAGSDVEAATRGAAMLAALGLGLDPAPLKMLVRPVTVPPLWREAYQPLRLAYDGARALYFNFDTRLGSGS